MRSLLSAARDNRKLLEANGRFYDALWTDPRLIEPERRYLSPMELDQSLTDGSADIFALSGHDPTLVKPPCWSFDAGMQFPEQRLRALPVIDSCVFNLVLARTAE